MKNINDLAKIFLKISTEKEMINFLYGLLTLGEIDELNQRIKIIKMLKRGIPQHDIAKKLGVGIATVTRGSNEIKKGRFISIK